ncbi:hypothetical protein AMTR_s00062p00131550 [Amborella trichopoda]|uniref:Uncharacterized protein n=1 Tax=Amborella trichopoda TaxID=13333 RepID=U5DDW4_AMBTC|nr:hypothetical protein AMTR_s00062p00131550 [Amborella trichopoda]
MTCLISRTIHPSSPGPDPRSGRKLPAFSELPFTALTATSLARHLSANKFIWLVHQPAQPVLAHPSLPSSLARCCVSLTKTFPSRRLPPTFRGSIGITCYWNEGRRSQSLQSRKAAVTKEKEFHDQRSVSPNQTKLGFSPKVKKGLKGMIARTEGV